MPSKAPRLPGNEANSLVNYMILATYVLPQFFFKLSLYLKKLFIWDPSLFVNILYFSFTITCIYFLVSSFLLYIFPSPILHYHKIHFLVSSSKIWCPEAVKKTVCVRTVNLLIGLLLVILVSFSSSSQLLQSSG